MTMEISFLIPDRNKEMFFIYFIYYYYYYYSLFVLIRYIYNSICAGADKELEKVQGIDYIYIVNDNGNLYT